jgi:hypothetical protein
VGDADQGQRPLAHRFPPQVGDPVLGHHVADVAAAGDHRRAFGEDGLDPAHRSPTGEGGEDDQRSTQPAPRRAAHEVHLPADAGIELAIERVRRHLAGEVHRQCGVDAHHPVVAGDDCRVVHPVAGPELQQWVVVRPAVEAGASHQERGDHLSGEHRLPASGHHSRLHQLHHRVGEHLGVNAQVAVTLQRSEDGRGRGPDSDLHRRPVGHQLGDVRADGLRRRVRHRGASLGDWTVDRDQVRAPAQVEPGVSVCPRHPGVDLGEDDPRRVHRGAHHVHADTEGGESLPVRRADLDQRRIGLEPASAEERRDLGEEHRGEVRSPPSHRLPDVGPDEEGVVAKAVGHRRVGVGGLPEGEDVEDLVVGEVRAVADHRLHQGRGDGGSRPDQDAVPGAERPDRLPGGAHPSWKPRRPVVVRGHRRNPSPERRARTGLIHRRWVRCRWEG